MNSTALIVEIIRLITKFVMGDQFILAEHKEHGLARLAIMVVQEELTLVTVILVLQVPVSV